MEINIARADSYDAEAISLIGKISFRKAFGNVFDNNDLDDYLNTEYDPDRIAVRINRENNLYLVARMDDRPVGFANVRKFSLNDEIESGAQMQLEKIYVLPGFQNSGAGTALLREVISLANEYCPDFIWLDVYSSNEKGIRFYERNGFKKMHTYYQGLGAHSFEFYMMALPVAENVDARQTLFCCN